MYSIVNIIVETSSNLLKSILQALDISKVFATTVIIVRKISITIVMLIIRLGKVLPDSIISKAFDFTFLYKTNHPHTDTKCILWDYYIILLLNMQHMK